MLAIVYFIITFLFGIIITNYFFRQTFKNNKLQIASAFILGNFFSTWIIFVFSLISSSFSKGIYLGFIEITIFCFISYIYNRKIFFITKPSKSDFIFYAVVFSFSFWIMEKTLGYQGNGVIKIGADVWGDFEMHLPLIRSFSWGNNMPPSSPFFPNLNLSYHFLFDFWAAILEFLGWPLIFSINTISIFSFFSLIVFIYELPQIIFRKSVLLGLLSVILFLFNSSLGFLDAINKLKPNSILEFLRKVWINDHYLSVGPFTDDKVSIMWNLNVYVNQRHFIYSLALALILVAVLYDLTIKKSNYREFIIMGIIWGLFPFWQSHIFISIGLVFFALMLFVKKNIKQFILFFVIGIIIAFPQVFWLAKDVQNSLTFNPGYLSPRPLTTINFISYWIFNLGLSLIIILLGFFIANRRQKYLFLSFACIFLIANLFQFNKEMFNNHKFFNFWIIIANFFSAFFLIHLIKKKYGLILFPIILFLLIFSGIIDFSVIKNQPYYTITDFPKNYIVDWVKENTALDSVFLVPQDEMYHPIRMAGRKTYLFRPRYAWAYGYDVTTRDQIIQKIYNADEPDQTKSIIEAQDIDYIIIPKQQSQDLPLRINYPFFRNNFTQVLSTNEVEILEIKKDIMK
ncbi:MAG: hypothetical protein M1524_03580 [Patescibacteria group bacterium]|nr:hypothetical protein [Patescibacteria group bacterium]